MKKLVLSVAIASVFGLSACDDESINEVQESAVENGTVVTTPARVVFNPSVGILSVPNDLLFSGTTDGTLFMPGEKDEDGSSHLLAPDYSDPSTALGALDGWSNVNPFSLAIEFPAGKTLDAASASLPSSVRIFEAVMGASRTDEDCATALQGHACKIVSELSFGVDFVTQASGNNVVVVPIKPLKPKTTYIVVLTSSLNDSNGDSIEPSTTYELVRQDIATLPLGNASQLGLQSVINSFEAKVEGEGVIHDEIIYTMAMTTQSTMDVLFTLKSLMAQQIATAGPAAIPVITMADTGLSVANVLDGKIPEESLPAFAAANYLKGTINLPYYSGVPSAENPFAPVNTAWKSRCDSGATLAGMDPSLIPADPLDANDGFCMAVGLRDLSSVITIDTQRHLTQFNPVPQANAMMPIDVQMTTPDLPTVNYIRSQLETPLPPLVEPAAGWPIVIMQHGITGYKEVMLPLTAMLSINGFATVAIDYPLHGTRGFDLNGDNVDDINASTVSTLHYVNLQNTITMRDNTRQSALDIVGLRLGLNAVVNAAGERLNVNGSKVHFVGHSLGAIYGINAVTLANTPLAPQFDPLLKITSSVFAMPGLMLANFGMESPAFEGLAKSNLTLSASADFKAYVDAKFPEGYTQDQLTETYFAFYESLSAPQKAGLDAVFTQFTFAAQTITESGDPISYIQTLAATQTPTLVFEIAGDGIDSLSDQVVTNTAPFTPLGGTEPAIALLGLPGVSETTAGSGAVRFKYGHHASLLDPRANASSPDVEKSADVALEMQTIMNAFFVTDGAMIVVTDTEVVN
ncbi:MAG: lipase [Colwellia sp.]|nr:lipase [Colwellia sp.]